MFNFGEVSHSLITSLQLFGNAACSKAPFLGLKPWYYYLPMDKNCEVQNFELLGSHSSIILIALAIIDDLLIIAGLAAVIYVIYAGIKYITSQGTPDEVAKSQSTLLNALIGLVIAVIAIGSVGFLGSQLAQNTATYTGTGSLNLSLLPTTSADKGLVATILRIVFGLAGALALLFVTIGGFKYVMSNGDPQATVRARNTILYALIGLAVAILGQFFVAFVLARVTS